MTNDDKVLELFHYFNIQAEVDSVYGNWAVSKNGDVINILYPYAIFPIHLNDCDWVETLKRKVWFEPECEVHLQQAINRAQIILNKDIQ